MRTAIIIPAYNEEQTIAQVMQEFHHELPDCEIYIVDNNSSDRTYSIATETYQLLGCKGRLLSEPRQGKALAVRTAFQSVDADVYLMVDGDCTYPADQVHEILAPVLNGEADMVVGDRLSDGHYSKENKRPLHDAGNRLIRWMINRLYDAQLKDILSGYRAFSRRFVDTFPILCRGFELETNLALHALDKRLKIIEIPVVYKDRPEGSVSKLNTIQDGARVLFLMFNIFRIYRPFSFFGTASLFCLILSLFAGVLPVLDYVTEKYVYHIPLALLASALVVLSVLFIAIALILDGMAIGHRMDFENQLVRYKDER
ncbi:MAG: glycosyltransferase [Kiritimatiellales bacterium]